MRALATPVRDRPRRPVDTAGTGGGRPTFNVSTTAALIAAGAGCAVAKHGNRSATGLSGSADVLEALGVRIDLAPEAVAPLHRRGRASASCSRPPTTPPRASWCPVRKELAVRTIFNFLGPLTNPAGRARQVIGVSDPAFLETIAGALARLGADRALVVSSDDGLDEMSTSGDHARRRGRRRASSRATRRARRTSGSRRAGPERWPAARRPTTPPTTRRILAGEPGPRARPRACSTPARRSTPPGRATTCGRASRAARGGVDAGARRRGARAARAR